jgi:hypothetical protein
VQPFEVFIRQSVAVLAFQGMIAAMNQTRSTSIDVVTESAEYTKKTHFRTGVHEN